MKLAIPTIHLNGTPSRMLIESLCEASDALNIAYAKVKQTGPNGRDYYPQGAKAMEQAEHEHSERLKRLDAVKDELDAMAVAIDGAASPDEPLADGRSAEGGR